MLQQKMLRSLTAPLAFVEKNLQKSKIYDIIYVAKRAMC
jgi:hypothetical protein